MINFECPKCHASLAVEDNQAGLSAQCPQCGNINPVPGQRHMHMEYDLKDRCSSCAVLPAADEKSRMWSAFCHFGGLVFLVPLNIIVPLVFWLIKKEELPTVDRHGKAALNFQITCVIVYAILFLLARFVGLIPLKVAFLLDFIFSLLAAVKTGQGKEAKYPFLFRFIS